MGGQTTFRTHGTLRVRSTFRLSFRARGGVPYASKQSTKPTAFEPTSKRRRGFPSETNVKRGNRIVHGEKELIERLGRNDPCPCGSGVRFQTVLPAQRTVRRRRAQPLLLRNDLGSRREFDRRFLTMGTGKLICAAQHWSQCPCRDATIAVVAMHVVRSSIRTHDKSGRTMFGCKARLRNARRGRRGRHRLTHPV